MRRARPTIRPCPKCGKPFRHEQWASFNGHTLAVSAAYTDGYICRPNMPKMDVLVRCPECGKWVWLEDTRIIRSYEGYEARKLPVYMFKTPEQARQFNDRIVEGYVPDSEYEESQFSQFPCDADYRDALESGAADTPERERYLRIRAWWVGNGSRRRAKEPGPLSDAEHRNLEALADLCDESDADQLLVKAEAMRELGRFAESCHLLIGLLNREDGMTAADLGSNGDAYGCNEEAKWNFRLALRIAELVFNCNI